MRKVASFMRHPPAASAPARSIGCRRRTRAAACACAAAVRPAAGRAPALPAATLKRWLDQGHDDAGRPVVTLDTRNAFEVEHGRFEGAIDWRLGKFSEFPEALRRNFDALRGKTVVSYCTGGIRCEKAALVMQEAGLDAVYQLEGGILKYFEEAGGAHFSGDCFVFDEREAVDAHLRPLASSPMTNDK